MAGIRRSPAGSLLLAIDQGTTNTRAALVEPQSGRAAVRASRPVGIAFPRPGHVEQDAAQIWSATLDAIEDCLSALPAADVAGITISSQRESVVCWHRRTGRPLGPVLGWQDARTAPRCEQIIGADPEAATLVEGLTGLSLDPMFSAPKMAASIESAVSAGVAVEDVIVGTMDSWLLWNLTGRHVTELGNASRTLLLSLESLEWHDGLLDLFGIPRHTLPSLLPSDGSFGTTRRWGQLPSGVPVLAVLADSHSAMYHHGCTQPGTGKATYGTGSSVMTPTHDHRARPPGIATSIAWHIGGTATFAREGNILASGSALDWMAQLLGKPDGVAGGAFLTELAAGVDDSNATYLVPAFTGLGSPYWDRQAIGLVAGVNGATSREHLARAALDAVAHQVTDVVEAIEADGLATIEVLMADGGATASSTLMQIQSTLLRRPVQVSDNQDASLLGAARLAACGLGCAPAATGPGRRFAPTTIDPLPQRQGWTDAVARARGVSVRHHDRGTDLS